MASVQPNSRTWTLRFKHHRTTVLLHVDPLQNLQAVKTELLSAIQQTHPSGKLNDHLIPPSADDIVLARPNDVNDLSAGWENLDPDDDGWEESMIDEGPGVSKAKGKGKAGTIARKGGKDAQMRDSVMGAGLKDGGVIAFKFRATDEAGDGEELDDDGLLAVKEKVEKWDVVVPSLEETYGDGEEDANMGIPRKVPDEVEDG